LQTLKLTAFTLCSGVQKGNAVVSCKCTHQ